MSSVFIFSSALSARTIIYDINYLLNTEIKEIILLKENHRATENFNMCGNIKVSIFDNLSECITRSDFVIILQNNNIPQSSISEIKLQTEKSLKKCYIIKDVWNNVSDNDIIPNPDSVISNYPIIVHISLGNITQPFYTEMALSKVMRKNNIKVKQYFTSSTKELLLQLSDLCLLNTKYFNVAMNYDLIIYSIDIGNDIFNIRKYINVFNQLDADYIILQVEKNFCDYENANNIIRYCCSSKLNTIIKSHFTLADDKYILYCDDIIDYSDTVYDVESDKLAELLFNSIRTKLSLPDGIIRL